jgi:hypothetical protein
VSLSRSRRSVLPTVYQEGEVMFGWLLKHHTHHTLTGLFRKG